MSKVKTLIGSRNSLINKADKYYSLLRRAKEYIKFGYCRCKTCGKIMFWRPKNRDCQLGHFLGRRSKGLIGTRWDDINTQIQCNKCNSNASWGLKGNIIEFEKYLKETYGNNIVGELEIAHQKPFQTFEIKILADSFEKQFKKLYEKNKDVLRGLK